MERALKESKNFRKNEFLKDLNKAMTEEQFQCIKHTLQGNNNIQNYYFRHDYFFQSLKPNIFKASDF